MGISKIGFPQNTVYRTRIQTSETLPVTLQASKYGEFSFDISADEGITPLGIVGWGCNETSQTFIHDFYMDPNGLTAKLYLKNPYNTDVSITSLWIDVLYKQIGLDMSEVTVIDNLTTDSGLDALSARQGKVLNEKIPPVVDNLNSTSTTSTLSAKQGKVINERLQEISDFSTTTEIVANTDLDTLTVAGTYYCGTGTISSTLTHSPINNSGFVMEVLNKGSQRTQVIHQGSMTYTRSRFSDGWGDWYRYDGTTVDMFKMRFLSIPSGTSSYAINAVCFVLITFTDSFMALYGCSNSSANKLCGDIPNGAAVSFNSGTLSVTNPNSWNTRAYLIYR